MMMQNKIRVAVVGLGFGAEFVPIYAANWTAAGICAHESAMAGGREVVVPEFG